MQIGLIWLVVAAGSQLIALPLMADPTGASSISPEKHRQLIETWRSSRHERLSRNDGWLTLVGLEWLKEGENRIGSAAGLDIQLGGGPAYWGSVLLQNNRLSFINSDSFNVKVDDESLLRADLIPDTEGRATVVSSGTLSFHVIHRESYALRIKDSQAKTLLDFKGVDNYPISESWRIEGRFTRSEDGTGLEIANVLGQVSESPVFGVFEFEKDGKNHSLMALGDENSESLWIIFADRSNGYGSYGAGRFLYSDGMPESGKLVVDFNKAYNPPCAFNPYSTCPLPPQQNRLDLLVEAGEKDFHPDSG